MDALRTSILRIADELTLSVRNAGQAFAFLSDGRELVELLQTDAGTEGRFPDHADEGWPALVFLLPRDTTSEIDRVLGRLVDEEGTVWLGEFLRAEQRTEDVGNRRNGGVNPARSGKVGGPDRDAP